jgi:hypothetical protein
MGKEIQICFYKDRKNRFAVLGYKKESKHPVFNCCFGNRKRRSDFVKMWLEEKRKKT